MAYRAHPLLEPSDCELGFTPTVSHSYRVSLPLAASEYDMPHGWDAPGNGSYDSVRASAAAALSQCSASGSTSHRDPPFLPWLSFPGVGVAEEASGASCVSLRRSPLSAASLARGPPSLTPQPTRPMVPAAPALNPATSEFDRARAPSHHRPRPQPATSPSSLGSSHHHTAHASLFFSPPPSTSPPPAMRTATTAPRRPAMRRTETQCPSLAQRRRTATVRGAVFRNGAQPPRFRRPGRAHRPHRPGTYGGMPQADDTYGGVPVAKESAYGGVYGESNEEGVYGEGDTVGRCGASSCSAGPPALRCLAGTLHAHAPPPQMSVGSMASMSKMSTMTSMAGYP